MLRRRTHVAVDQHDRFARTPEDERERQAGGALALGGARARDHHRSRHSVIGREGQIRADREIGFGYLRLGVRDLVEDFAVDDRNASEQRDLKQAVDLPRLAQPLIDLFEREHRRSRQHQPDEHGEREIGRQARPRRAFGRFRAVDDRHVVGRNARDPDLLVALQQPVIKLAVGVHFTLVNIVLDAVATLHIEIAADCSNALPQALLTTQRAVVIVGDAALHAPLFARDRAVKRGYLLLERAGDWVTGLELDKQLGAFRRNLGAALSQRGNRGIGKRACVRAAARSGQAALCGDPPCGRFG